MQAATALNYIDHKMFDANIVLKKKWEEQPENPQAMRAYAVHTEKYIHAQILDKDRLAKNVA